MRLERVLVDEAGSAGLAPNQDLAVHSELVLLHLAAGVEGLVARYAGPADFFPEILRHFQFLLRVLRSVTISISVCFCGSPKVFIYKFDFISSYLSFALDLFYPRSASILVSDKLLDIWS